MEDIKDGYAEYDMPEETFKKLGKRDSYTFRLDIVDNEVANNIGGSAVARDLYDALEYTPGFKELAKGKHIIFRMDKQFVLYIEVLDR